MVSRTPTRFGPNLPEILCGMSTITDGPADGSWAPRGQWSSWLGGTAFSFPTHTAWQGRLQLC